MQAPPPSSLKEALSSLPLADLRYFASIDSTNTNCLAWAGEGAADISLAVADHQSAGRGRAGRKWITNPGASLAFSLILRPRENEHSRLAFFSPLGAVGIRSALERDYQLPAEIKWPNDVLVGRKKLAGILVENTWEAHILKAIVIGIGINITPEAMPPEHELLFPATCLEAAAGVHVDRWALLANVLSRIIQWREKLGSREFFQEWSNHLAFRDERVCISGNLNADIIGRLAGIDADGNLLVDTDDGRREKITVGDVRLRAV